MYFWGPAATDGSRALGPGFYLCKLGADPKGHGCMKDCPFCWVTSVFFILGCHAVCPQHAKPLLFQDSASLVPTHKAKTPAACFPSVPSAEGSPRNCQSQSDASHVFNLEAFVQGPAPRVVCRGPLPRPDIGCFCLCGLQSWVFSFLTSSQVLFGCCEPASGSEACKQER